MDKASGGASVVTDLEAKLAPPPETGQDDASGAPTGDGDGDGVGPRVGSRALKAPAR